MRVSVAVLAALPALSLAQQQIPFQDKVQHWFNTAQEFVKNVASVPIEAGAARVAKDKVQPITLGNWKQILAPTAATGAGGKPDEWMVYVTGENKTCGFGFCQRADKAWNESVALLTGRASEVHLGKINCDEQELLCGAWAAKCPSIWHFLIPKPLPDQSKAATPIHIIELNRTSVVTSDITEIHTKQKYLDKPEYDGLLHPIDGLIAQLGLTMPMAYVLFGIAKIPSWAFMIVISFFSRQFMAKRIVDRNQPPPGARPAAAS